MNEQKTILRWFCGCFIATIVILVIYLWFSISTFKDSQERIVTEHIKHIANVDSVFYDIKTIILSNDSGTIVNAPLLLSQLQNDSALLRREILLSQAEASNLVALHIDKIDNDYSQIGIWGGLLSIIFLIFGFFAIFKIEEAKAEAKNTLEEVEAQGDNSIARINELQAQAAQLNNSFNAIRQESETFIADSKREFRDLITNINDEHSHSQDSIRRINVLLEEIETKNQQYEWSNNRMNDLMGQLSTLIDKLNISNNNDDETDHE